MEYIYGDDFEGSIIAFLLWLLYAFKVKIFAILSNHGMKLELDNATTSSQIGNSFEKDKNVLQVCFKRL